VPGIEPFQVFQQVVGVSGPVPPHQHFRRRRVRYPGQRVGQDPDVIGDRVRTGVALTQQQTPRTCRRMCRRACPIFVRTVSSIVSSSRRRPAWWASRAPRTGSLPRAPARPRARTSTAPRARMFIALPCGSTPASRSVNPTRSAHRCNSTAPAARLAPARHHGRPAHDPTPHLYADAPERCPFLRTGYELDTHILAGRPGASFADFPSGQPVLLNTLVEGRHLREISVRSLPIPPTVTHHPKR
jgi:hypothetical protein